MIRDTGHFINPEKLYKKKKISINITISKQINYCVMYKIIIIYEQSMAFHIILLSE